MPLGRRSLVSSANAMNFMLCPPFKLAASNTLQILCSCQKLLVRVLRRLSCI